MKWMGLSWNCSEEDGKVKRECKEFETDDDECVKMETVTIIGKGG